MKKIYTLSILFFAFGFTTVAQNNHFVEANGMSFIPNNLTIQVGDTVVWENTGGTHNVNGTTVTYPSNPESFGNTVGASGWVYKHKFTIAGTYQYRCDVHGVNMSGTIVVTAPTIVQETKTLKDVSVYPNPSSDKVFINLNGRTVKETALFDITGKKMSISFGSVANDLVLDVSSLAKGVYFVNLKVGDMAVTKKLIVE
ncbi:MAG: T9SS type A sorting domain-containing protein [Flavobacteriales bacterium]